MNFNQLPHYSEYTTLIAKIDSFRSQWISVQWLRPEILGNLKMDATIESAGSSTRIEGSKLSNESVAILLNGMKTRPFASRDEEEVAGYAKTLNEILESYTSIEMTENYIKQLHQMTLQYSSKDIRHRGEYKTLDNHVAAFEASGKMIGIIFQTATPFETPERMRQLIEWQQRAFLQKDQHDLLLIGIFVVNFLAIHPFQDGNGRLSRLLTTLLLLKCGYLYAPYSSMERQIEDDKGSYYAALRETQVTLRNAEPDYRPWLNFFLQKLSAQIIHLRQKVEAFQKIDSLPNLDMKIMRFVENQGLVTRAELMKSTQANLATLKLHLSKLVKQRKLVLHGKTKGASYSLPKMRDI